jgi:hypothetical protein
MNLDKSNTATPLGTDKIVINRQDVAEYTCTLEKLRGYKSYVALFSVADDPAQIPEIVVINNDFKTDFIFTPTGNTTPLPWEITPVSNEAIFTNNKTVCFFQNSRITAVPQFDATVSWQFSRTSDTTCLLAWTAAAPHQQGDDLSFYNCSLEIRVYN